MSKNREKKHTAHLKERQDHEHEVIEKSAGHHEQHLVEAPKGTSRMRFFLQFLLVVFLLMIFSITGPVMDALSGGGGGGDDIYMSWTSRSGERHTLTNMEFFQQKRNFAQLEVVYRYMNFGAAETGDDEDTARFLILEQLAAEAGVIAAESEVAETIIALWQSVENYKGYIASRRDLTPVAYEKLLRRALAVRRYLMLYGSGAREVGPERIIERWQLTAKEYSFDYVEAIAADFEEETRAALPADQELQDWFDGLPPFQKSRFNTKESMSADLAWFDPAEERTYEALFERYPRPEDEDAEEMAQNYYNSFSHVRFARPEPEPGEEGSEDPEVPEHDHSDPDHDHEAAVQAEAEAAAEAAAREKYYAFDEVAERVGVEAPIYYSMVDWLSHMQKRQAEGEAFDMQTEAISLGFQFERVEPRTREGWTDTEDIWSGRYLGSSMMSAPEGEFAPRVSVGEKVLVASKILERMPPTLPPFAEIRDGVADKWVDEEAPRVAAAKLETVRDAFGDRPETGVFATTADRETFTAAVEAAGLSVVTRDYQRQFPRVGPDDPEPTLVDNYLRSTTTLYGMEPDQVAKAEATRDGQAAYLVRFAGKRDGDVATMEPSEAEQALLQLSSGAEQEFFSRTFHSNEWIKQEFNLALKSWEIPEEPAPTN